MTEEIIIAGFGGQGVLSMGQLLAYAGMLENKQVTWLPSYGPEMRGGTANCNVIVTDEEIGSPVIESATAALVLNRPSLDKFELNVKPNGLLFINSSIIDVKTSRKDVAVHYIPANDVAKELGNAKVMNMVMLGAYIATSHVVSIDSVMESLRGVLGTRKEHLLPLNRQALERGAELLR